MKLVRFDRERNAAAVQALYAVASGGGHIAPTPVEVASIEAIQRHIFLQDTPIAGSPGPLPADLAQAIADPETRLALVRLMAMLPPVDKQLRLEKIAVVEQAAKDLGVREFGISILRAVAVGKPNRIMFKLMKRFIDHYWPIGGEPDAREWVSLAWSVMPWFPGLRRWLELDELLANYRGLEKLPAGTLGHEVHRYYATNGFPIPGTKGSIPEGWARHEVYHIISNYKPSMMGEMLLAAFIAGNTRHMALETALPALIQLHAGKKFAPGPVGEDLFLPDEFFRAMARGATMSVDLLAGWRLWEHAGAKLDELRGRYRLPDITADERRALAPHDAVLA
jgi:hypothetical protein